MHRCRHMPVAPVTSRPDASPHSSRHFPRIPPSSLSNRIAWRARSAQRKRHAFAACGAETGGSRPRSAAWSGARGVEATDLSGVVSLATGFVTCPTAATRSDLPRRASIDLLGLDRAPDPNPSSPGQTEGPNTCPLAFSLLPDSQGWFGGSGPLGQSSISFDATG